MNKYKCVQMLSLLIVAVSVRVYTQTVHYYSQSCYLSLSDTGTYVLGNLMSDQPAHPYEAQHIYSYGQYRKEGRYYILSADSSICNNQGECRSFSVAYSNIPQKDSLVVLINSPYEEKVKSQMYNRIVFYNVIVFLSNGQIINSGDTKNRISMHCDSSSSVSKLELYITNLPDLYRCGYIRSYTGTPYCFITLDAVPSNSNIITIQLPTFEYFSLTYACYRNYEFRILNKHQIFSRGQIFTKLDRKQKRHVKKINRPKYIFRQYRKYTKEKL